jgi:3-oxoacyl-[acyl-carrier protein] reductase
VPTPAPQSTPRLQAADAQSVNGTVPKLTGDIRHLIPKMDLVKHGIRVNSLTPTATDTDEGIERGVAWGRPRPEPRGRALDFAKMLPMGKLPSPRHYARACVFLASDDAEMITGADLRVDAGAIAKYWPWIPNA